MALDVKLPDLNDTDFNSEKSIRQLRDYMYKLQEQLNYILANLDEENLSSTLIQKIENAAESGGGLNAEMEDELAGIRSSIKQNADNIALRVEKGEIISEINQSAEEIKIKAEKISLEGLVTVNKGFEIRADGSMKATAGSLGAFSADAAGNLAGAASLKVGGMTFSGNRAAGLKIGVDNLIYVSGPPSGSLDAYFLMVSDTGELCLAEVYIQNGQIAITKPGNAPGQSGSTNVIMITAAGNSLSKWSAPSTMSSFLGTCQAGEVYNYTGSLTSSEGYMWAYCSKKYTYNNSAMRWVASSVTPFYIPQSSGGELFFDITTVNT